MIKKFIIILLLTLTITTPSYAMNLIEKIIYKEVVLRNNAGAVVLVNRLTGQVEYVKSGEEYVHLEDKYKKQFQAVYSAQEKPLRR